MGKNKQAVSYGANVTARLFDIEYTEPETKLNIPHEDAVKDAKQWVDDNEL